MCEGVGEDETGDWGCQNQNQSKAQAMAQPGSGTR